jgi:hypothetical protein
MGVAELNVRTSGLPKTDACPTGPYAFGPGNMNNPCDQFRFWSLTAAVATSCSPTGRCGS